MAKLRSGISSTATEVARSASGRTTSRSTSVTSPTSSTRDPPSSRSAAARAAPCKCGGRTLDRAQGSSASTSGPSAASTRSPGIHVRIGDQADSAFLGSVLDEFGPPDAVLDDGSHVMQDVTASFHHLYPALADRGVYMVEDLHTAYWPRFGGRLAARRSVRRAREVAHRRPEQPPYRRSFVQAVGRHGRNRVDAFLQQRDYLRAWRPG